MNVQEISVMNLLPGDVIVEGKKTYPVKEVRVYPGGRYIIVNNEWRYDIIAKVYVA